MPAKKPKKTPDPEPTYYRDGGLGAAYLELHALRSPVGGYVGVFNEDTAGPEAARLHYDAAVRRSIEHFERTYEPEGGILLLGRSGRHVCIADTPRNRERYAELQQYAIDAAHDLWRKMRTLAEPDYSVEGATKGLTRTLAAIRNAESRKDTWLCRLAAALAVRFPDVECCLSRYGDYGTGDVIGYFPGVEHLDGGGEDERFARVLYSDPEDSTLKALGVGERLRILERSDDDEGYMIRVVTVDRPVPVDGWVSIDFVIGTNVPVPE